MSDDKKFHPPEGNGIVDNPPIPETAEHWKQYSDHAAPLNNNYQAPDPRDPAPAYASTSTAPPPPPLTIPTIAPAQGFETGPEKGAPVNIFNATIASPALPPLSSAGTSMADTNSKQPLGYFDFQPALGQGQGQATTPITALNTAPALVYCPVCGATALTVIQARPGLVTHLWAVGCCLLFFLGCIPYLFASFQDLEHHCGRCGVALATWTRTGGVRVHQVQPVVVKAGGVQTAVV